MSNMQSNQFDDGGFFKMEFSLNTPQKINVLIQGDYATFMKQDVVIFRLNIEDYEAIKQTLIIFDGVVRAGIIFGELENIRDVLKDIELGARDK
jgi:hypothetical protein